MLRISLWLVALSTIFGSAVLAAPPTAPSNEFWFVGFSTTTIMPAPNVGFPGMHEVCQDDFGNPDARICTSTEYVLSPTAVLPSSDSWIQYGGPGGSEITADGANCENWTRSPGTGWTARTDGTFGTTQDGCGTSKPVTCCAPIQ